MKTVLLLGSGLTAAPLVRYFVAHEDVRLLVASLDFSRIASLAGDHHDRITLRSADVTDESVLRSLIGEADVVVSLLPAPLLPRVCRLAVAMRRPVVSTSYTPPEVHALDEDARRAGVLLLNEMGFDPGIDHMAVMRTIRMIRAEGGTVTRFMSAAGGLPAPEANDNPWGYKFAWNPRAVVMAGRSDARFLRDGALVDVPGAELFEHCWPYEVESQGLFEVYPNRDALHYREAYELDETEDVFRGTIRYPGWCATMAAAAKLGLFDVTPIEWPAGSTHADLTFRRVGGSSRSAESLAQFLGRDRESPAIVRLEWAGFFSDEPLPARTASPLDLFVAKLEKLLRYEPGERDMVILQHHLEATFSDGHREELGGGIVAFGQPGGDSAMSRLVALPAAIAAAMILDGKLEGSGVMIPTVPEVFVPVLNELAELGIEVTERRVRHDGGGGADVTDSRRGSGLAF